MKKMKGMIIGVVGVILFLLAARYDAPFIYALAAWALALAGLIMHVRELRKEFRK